MVEILIKFWRILKFALFTNILSRKPKYLGDIFYISEIILMKVLMNKVNTEKF